jgi:NAD(P)-dependent dehydrogenase (short-subunit alcohol dehydrogenase family)
MAQEFAGRVVIVTGAGKGIGQATAIAFAKQGSHVVLSGQSKEPLMQTLALIEECGEKAPRLLAMLRPKTPRNRRCRPR